MHRNAACYAVYGDGSPGSSESTYPLRRKERRKAATDNRRIEKPTQRLSKQSLLPSLTLISPCRYWRLRVDRPFVPGPAFSRVKQTQTLDLQNRPKMDGSATVDWWEWEQRQWARSNQGPRIVRRRRRGGCCPPKLDLDFSY